MVDRPSGPAAALRLPHVPAQHLDAVIRAAGPNRLAALAVLASAIGWIIGRNGVPRARPALHEGVKLAIVRAVGLHGDVAGQG